MQSTRKLIDRTSCWYRKYSSTRVAVFLVLLITNFIWIMCTSTTMSTSSTSSISQDQQKQEHDSHGFTPLLQSLRKDKLRHTDNAIVKMLPPSNQLSCESIPDMVAGNLSHAKINSLRRQLMIKDTECFQTHAALFMDVFQHRLLTKHVMLHIPKAGGTSSNMRQRQARKNLGQPRRKLLERRLLSPLVWMRTPTNNDLPFTQQMERRLRNE